LKVIINGIGGKVGRILFNTISALKDAVVVCGVDKFARESDFPIPVFKEFCDEIPEADIIIDFSRPEAVREMLPYAMKHKVNVVIATTGHSEQDLELIELASKQIAVFISSNMSLGINLLSDISKQAAKFLGDAYDVEIIEQHHNMKIDAPSGTALYLAEGINKVFESGKRYVYGRHSKTDARDKSDIGIHAIRGGTIVGKHDVMFIGTDEIVTLSHEAQSRKVFAYGAIRAARYILEKSSGKYNMDNILGKDYAVTTVSGTSDTVLITINSITSEGFNGMLRELALEGINLDMISRIMNSDRSDYSVSFTLPGALKKSAYDTLNKLNIRFNSKEDAAKLLIAGAGMVHQCGVAEEVFTLLNNIGTTVYAVTTSETEISCCIDDKDRLTSEKMLRNHYGISI
jgi:4-hydroxy-tetrahydrodipicolinate reductase